MRAEAQAAIARILPKSRPPRCAGTQADASRSAHRHDNAGCTSSNRFDLETRAGLLDETLTIANYSGITHGVVAAVLVVLFWSTADRAYLVGMAVAVVTITVLTLFLAWIYRRAVVKGASEALVARGYRIAGALAFSLGVTWSTMPVVLFGPSDSDQRLLVVAIAAGLISDAYVVGPIFAISMLFTTPVVVASFIALAATGEPIAFSIAVLLAVYATFVLVSVRRMSHLSRQRILDRVRVQDQSQTIGLLLNEFEENTSDWLWETDRTGRLRHVSSRMASVVGCSAETLHGTVLSDLLKERSPTGDETGAVEAVAESLRLHSAFRDLVLNVDTDHGRRWWQLSGKPFLNADGAFAGFRGVGSDITQSRAAEARISYLASRDTLTGLSNRAMFNDEAAKACSRDTRRSGMVALLYLDLDGFKEVNDTLGHNMGDQLLAAVAERLLAFTGERVQAFRLGGDEFAVLMRCEHEHEAEHQAGLLITSLREPFRMHDSRIEVGGSVGLAFAPTDAQDPHDLLRKADLALYSAKADGKGQWRRFDADLEHRHLRRSELAAAMRVGLERGEMDLHYQPLVDLTTKQVVGFEALLRWTSPIFGPVSPAEVIPIAESTGFIAAIGRWALARACKEAVTWPDGIQVAVNISSIQFRMPGFSDEVETILRATGLPPGRLEIEITESIFLNETPEIVENLGRLRRLGVRIALDDFGTGYSSLSYLARFPVDKIKIDRSFVRDATTRQECIAVIEAVMVIAERLSVQVTVEGVETVEQADMLQRRRCHIAQGYLYSQARPAAEVPALIASALLNSQTLTYGRHVKAA